MYTWNYHCHSTFEYLTKVNPYPFLIWISPITLSLPSYFKIALSQIHVVVVVAAATAAVAPLRLLVTLRIFCVVVAYWSATLKWNKKKHWHLKGKPARGFKVTRWSCLELHIHMNTWWCTWNENYNTQQ